MNPLHYTHSWVLDSHVDRYFDYDGKDFPAYVRKLLQATPDRRSISLQLHREELDEYLATSVTKLLLKIIERVS